MPLGIFEEDLDAADVSSHCCPWMWILGVS